MKKLTVLLLVLMTVLTLCSCGGAKEDTSIYGTYTLYAMDYDEGIIVQTADLFDGESFVTIKSGGAVINLEGDESNVTWKADGSKIVFSASDGDMNGTLKDGMLTLDVEGTNLYFFAEGASKDAIDAKTLDEVLNGLLGGDSEGEDGGTAGLTEVQELWNGWWYGCADITSTEGDYNWMNNMTFDVAMYVELDAEGNGTLDVYDLYGEMTEGDVLDPYISLDCHADTMYLYGDSGYAYGSEIYANDWRVVHNLLVPEEINVGSSISDDGGKFSYDLTLLPWGNRWEGIEYTKFIPHFNEYLAMIDAGYIDPYGTTAAETEPATAQTTAAPAPSDGGSSGVSSNEPSPLLGSNPSELDVNGKGVLYVYYPDGFVYDDDYGKLKNSDTGVGILIDPMLGSKNMDELKKSYEENNSDEDDYSLTDTTVNGYKAMILKYSDWLGATMRVDVDFGGEHDGFYGVSFAVSGDSLSDCDTEIVWAIINSMKLAK